MIEANILVFDLSPSFPDLCSNVSSQVRRLKEASVLDFQSFYSRCRRLQSES